MTDGAIKVSYETIEQAGSDCQSAGGQLNSLFETLKSQLNPLVNGWEGDAQAAWQDVQKRWDDAFQEMNALLHRIATALPQIADAYRQTEGGVTKSFSG